MSDEARLEAEFTHEQYTESDRPDTGYYTERATAVDGPVLEMGCGTGRIYLELLRAGVDADGFDLSAASLSVLREMAAEENLPAKVWQADMSDFAVDREYELVTCPFNAFQNLRDRADQCAALECVHDALASGGEFVFDVFVPNFEFICETYGEWQTNTVEFRGQPHEHRNRARIVDEVNLEVVVENEVIDPDGEQLFAEQHRITILPYGELELLVEASPFEEWTVTGDFTDEPLADGHKSQVWTLQV